MVVSFGAPCGCPSAILPMPQITPCCQRSVLSFSCRSFLLSSFLVKYGEPNFSGEGVFAIYLIGPHFLNLSSFQEWKWLWHIRRNGGISTTCCGSASAVSSSAILFRYICCISSDGGANAKIPCLEMMMRSSVNGIHGVKRTSESSSENISSARIAKRTVTCTSSSDTISHMITSLFINLNTAKESRLNSSIAVSRTTRLVEH